MRTYAHSDSEGHIEALILVDGPKDVAAGVSPRPGISVDEVGPVDLSPHELDVEAASRLIKTHKLPPGASKRELIEREETRD